MLHSQIRDLVHRRASELLHAQSSQMFRADVTAARKRGERPSGCGSFCNFVPQLPKSVTTLPGAGNTRRECVNETHPMVQHFRVACVLPFFPQPGNRSRKFTSSGRSNGRRGTNNRLHPRRFLVADPCENKSFPCDRTEGVEHAGRRHADSPGDDTLPPTIKQDTAFPVDASEDKAPRGL